MKKRILFPIVAVLFALSAAFATEAVRNESEVFASVEYLNGGHCITNTNCSTSPSAQMCSNTFKSGTGCVTPIASWLIE